MKIKAAVLHEMGKKRPYSSSKPLEIEEVTLEKPGRREVLVKIHAAGLCHSDLSVIDGNRERPLPMVLGHEAAGEIVELGEGVERLKKGDHVVFTFLPICGHCVNCQSGRPALCENGAKANAEGVLMGGHRRIKKGNRKYYHHLGVSGFAEYAVASIDSLVKIDPEIPFDIAALFGCAIITGVGAVVNTSQTKVGDTVAVVGLGGVGLSAILGAKAAGASRIIAADVSSYKRDLAKAFGATDVIDSGAKNAVEEIKDLTQGGVDISVEFAGVVPALEFAYHATKRGGTTVTAALPHPKEQFSIFPTNLVAEEKSIKGCYLGSCVPKRDIPSYMELYKNGGLPVEKLITHQLKLEDINEGFERLAAGEAIRQVVLLDH